MKTLVAHVTLAIALATSLGGCTIDLGNLLGSGSESSPVQSASPQPTFAQEFDANDVMFAQMMIVHHEQAVEMASRALDASSNSEIRDLAQQILDAQQPEIETMGAWLTAAGASTDHLHDMTMPGLADAATMDELNTSTDAAFDSLFLMTMIQHHEGAITMANDVLSTTMNDDVRALASAVVAAQTAEIDAMYLLLGP